MEKIKIKFVIWNFITSTYAVHQPIVAILCGAPAAPPFRGAWSSAMVFGQVFHFWQILLALENCGNGWGVFHKWRHTILGKNLRPHPLATFRHKYLPPFKYNVTICNPPSLHLQLQISIYFVSA